MSTDPSTVYNTVLSMVHSADEDIVSIAQDFARECCSAAHLPQSILGFAQEYMPNGCQA